MAEFKEAYKQFCEFLFLLFYVEYKISDIVPRNRSVFGSTLVPAKTFPSKYYTVIFGNQDRKK